MTTDSKIVRLKMPKYAKEYLLENGAEQLSDLAPWQEDNDLKKLMSEGDYTKLKEKVEQFSNDLEDNTSEYEDEPTIEDSIEVVIAEDTIEEVEVREKAEEPKSEIVERTNISLWDPLSPRNGEEIPDIVKEKYYGAYFAPKNLLDYAVKPDIVIIILGNGGKHTFGL